VSSPGADPSESPAVPSRSLAPSQSPSTLPSRRMPGGGQGQLRRSLIPRPGKRRVNPPSSHQHSSAGREAWAPFDLGPSGASPVQPSPLLIPPKSGQGHFDSQLALLGSRHTDAPELGMLWYAEPPLGKEGLRAGIVTAFNLTRIDTSFKTILVLPLF